jgi:hypothetical protein
MRARLRQAAMHTQARHVTAGAGRLQADSSSGAGQTRGPRLKFTTRFVQPGRRAAPVIPRTDLAVNYDAATNVARFTYLANPAGILLDGGYHAEFPVGILENFGNASTDSVLLDFFFLQGDANHDRRVNLADFNILAANFGQSNRTFAQGDFDHSGKVNLIDFNTLASRFGRVVSPFAGDVGRGGVADESYPTTGNNSSA